MKKFARLSLKLLVVFSILGSVGCQAMREREIHKELETITELSMRLNHDNEALYFEALKREPDTLTAEIYQSAFLHMVMIWEGDRSANTDSHLENKLPKQAINALCLNSKLLKSPKYIHLNKMPREDETNQIFWTWLDQKQVVWQDILKKETSVKLEHSCLDIG